MASEDKFKPITRIVVADSCYLSMEIQKMNFQTLFLSKNCDFCLYEDECCEKVYEIIRLELLKPLKEQSIMPICLIIIDPTMEEFSGLKAVKTIKSFFEEVNLTRELKLREPNIVFVTSYPIR